MVNPIDGNKPLMKRCQRVSYSAPLDGLRAVAILAVLLFHIDARILPGGFVGVDVFFVLSGYLITSNILREVRERRFSLREFYLRRVQRLLPNVVATVLGVLALWSLLLPASSAAPAGRHGLWALFNISNLYIWKYLGGYWGESAESAPLTHTWSLGIEEQFYLLFPLVLLLLARRFPRRTSLVLAVGALCSFALCAVGTYRSPVATFYLLPTRFWELLLGAALASQAPTDSSSSTTMGLRPLNLLGWSGLTAILVATVLIRHGSLFPGFVSLLPTVGTLFILIAIVDRRTTIARLLSLRLVVQVGKLSYSLYLWHWPLIVLGKRLAVLWGFAIYLGSTLGAVAGVLLSWLAYHFVEQPLRKRDATRRYRLVGLAFGFAIVAGMCVVVGYVRKPIADPLRRFEQPRFEGQLFNAGPPPRVGCLQRPDTTTWRTQAFQKAEAPRGDRAGSFTFTGSRRRKSSFSEAPTD